MEEKKENDFTVQADEGKDPGLKDGKKSRNLARLSKSEILKIMIAQGEEIDRLNAKVAELEAELADRKIKMSKVGSIAEASLALTKIFQEADEAAALYLENVRRGNG